MTGSAPLREYLRLRAPPNDVVSYQTTASLGPMGPPPPPGNPSLPPPQAGPERQGGERQHADHGESGVEHGSPSGPMQGNTDAREPPG